MDNMFIAAQVIIAPHLETIHVYNNRKDKKKIMVCSQNKKPYSNENKLVTATCNK